MNTSRSQSWVSRWWFFPMLLLALFPASAHAHAPIQNIGDFVNGAVHPLLTTSHLLILLGLGLMIGQRVPLTLKMFFMAFVPFSAVALLLTMAGLVTSVYQPVLIGIALCVGSLVALEKPLPSVATGGIFATAALAIGFDSSVESSDTMIALKTLSGTFACLTIFVIVLAYYVSLCTRWKWAKIGIRVMGSWIIAISLLVLAFALKK